MEPISNFSNLNPVITPNQGAESSIFQPNTPSRDITKNLPQGWIEIMHASGVPVYFHQPTFVCTFSPPYFVGPIDVSTHDVPISAVPCYARQEYCEKPKLVIKTVPYLNQCSGPIPSMTSWVIENQNMKPAQLHEYCSSLFFGEKKNQNPVADNYLGQNRYSMATPSGLAGGGLLNEYSDGDKEKAQGTKSEKVVHASISDTPFKEVDGDKEKFQRDKEVKKLLVDTPSKEAHGGKKKISDDSSLIYVPAAPVSLLKSVFNFPTKTNNPQPTNLERKRPLASTRWDEPMESYPMRGRGISKQELDGEKEKILVDSLAAVLQKRRRMTRWDQQPDDVMESKFCPTLVKKLDSGAGKDQSAETVSTFYSGFGKKILAEEIKPKVSNESSSVYGPQLPPALLESQGYPRKSRPDTVVSRVLERIQMIESGLAPVNGPATKKSDNGKDPSTKPVETISTPGGILSSIKLEVGKEKMMHDPVVSRLKSQGNYRGALQSYVARQMKTFHPNPRYDMTQNPYSKVFTVVVSLCEMKLRSDAASKPAVVTREIGKAKAMDQKSAIRSAAKHALHMLEKQRFGQFGQVEMDNWDRNLERRKRRRDQEREQMKTERGSPGRLNEKCPQM